MLIITDRHWHYAHTTGKHDVFKYVQRHWHKRCTLKAADNRLCLNGGGSFFCGSTNTANMPHLDNKHNKEWHRFRQVCGTGMFIGLSGVLHNITLSAHLRDMKLNCECGFTSQKWRGSLAFLNKNWNREVRIVTVHAVLCSIMTGPPVTGLDGAGHAQ